MKSPRHSTLPETKPKKLLPASAATTIQRKHKITNSNNDEGLQSTDTRRRYMRRGSKTPTMLLMEASRDLDVLGRSLFPSLASQHSDVANISYHTLNSKALAMAAAIDVLPDSYLVHCRVKRRSNPWAINETTTLVTSITNSNSHPLGAMSTYEGNEPLIKRHTPGHCIQQRRFSAMTALKYHLEKSSISDSTSSTCVQGKND